MTKPLLILLCSTLLISCTRSRPGSPNIPQPNPQPTVAANVSDRVKQMRELTNQLIQLVNQLPAPDDNAQRDALRAGFDLCARILPLLMGPDADGQFRLQERIVADARDQLARGGDRLALEPTADAGLRAVYNALVRVSQESFYTSPNITADLTELQSRVDALDTVRGPMHRDAASHALGQSAAVMDRMTRIYSARLDRRGKPEPAQPNPKGPTQQP